MKRKPLIAIINKIQDKLLLKYKYRKLWIKFVKFFLDKFFDHNYKEDVSKLNKDGYLTLNEISPKITNQIKKIAEENYLYDPWNKELGHFTKKNRPANITVARLVNPASYEEIQNLALNIDTLRIAASYFNCKCVIDSVDVWWSFPSVMNPFEAENFHRDRDSSEFLKWFVYLTDVDDFSGPHEYALSSLDSDIYTKGGRYLDEQIYKYFKTKKFYGLKGTNFLENTYGLHRGHKPQKKERLLLQVRYSIHGSSFRYKQKIKKKDFNDIAMSYSYIN